ncbi:MAG: 4-hydroxythreonine-4-phosphate dehydrogenase PdxA [Gammaproteobacteria bacterium]|nr:4-hydroxythreonine-4-phosphate dehydrogenase PdxA [Gammaproteobacteria bacterium]
MRRTSTCACDRHPHLSGVPQVIALTSGEPAGIGPDLCAMLAQRDLPLRLAVLGDPAVLDARAAALGIALDLRLRKTPDDVEPHARGALEVLPEPAAAPVVPGRLDPANADYVLRMLRRAAALCMDRSCAALVTAPVQKSVISHAGVAFSGHTEFLAELTGAPLPVMMLASEALRVALLTTHLPLRAVPDAVTRDRIERTVEVLHRDLRARFGIDAPRILVLGLNPHAGEQATLGVEERDVIEPAVQGLIARGFDLTGPVAGDTAFTRESLGRCDAVLAMYHDQGLAPLKALSFGGVVNVTLGLPIVRTSVDHGTALTLAGTGRAKADSLLAAVSLAHTLAGRAASRA